MYGTCQNSIFNSLLSKYFYNSLFIAFVLLERRRIKKTQKHTLVLISKEIFSHFTAPREAGVWDKINENTGRDLSLPTKTERRCGDNTEREILTRPRATHTRRNTRTLLNKNYEDGIFGTTRLQLYSIVYNGCSKFRTKDNFSPLRLSDLLHVSQKQTMFKYYYFLHSFIQQRYEYVHYY